MTPCIRLTLTLAVALSIIGGPALAGQVDRIAVIELRNEAGVTTQEANILTSLVRRAALVLPSNRYSVMTRDNILEMLPPGTQIEQCVGECEIETGRKLGAQFVVTGEVSRFGRELRVSLSLYSTVSSKLLASEVASAPEIDGLERPLIAASERLFAKLGVGGERVTVAPPIRPGKGRIFVRANPIGASVWIDGQDMGTAGAAGLYVHLSPGEHEVTVQSPGHMEKRMKVQVRAGEAAEASVDLPPSTPQTIASLDTSGERGLLSIRSEPGGAAIYLDGQRIGKLSPASLTLPPGRYVLQLRKDMYTPSREQVVDLKAGEPSVVKVTLKPNFGALRVDSTPAGAEVIINGRTVGQTPFKRARFQAGELKIELRYPLHLLFTRTATLDPGGEVSMSPKLRRSYGRFKIESDPSDAEVTLDGESRGRTPLTLAQVPRGPHTLTLSAPLYAPVERRLEVEPGDERTITMKLRPNFGTVWVHAPEQAARVFIDGEDRGRPGKVRLAPGPHTVEVRPDDGRYYGHRESLKVARAETIDVRPTLRPRMGGLLIASDPPEARIFVDGKAKAGEPVKVELLVGEHTLRAEKDGFSPATTKVVVKEGKQQTVMLKLSTKGSLFVESDPSGATVRCLMKDHVTVEHTVRVRDGHEVKVHCTMLTMLARDMVAEARASKQLWGGLAFTVAAVSAGAGMIYFNKAASEQGKADDAYAKYMIERSNPTTVDMRYGDVQDHIDARELNRKRWIGLGGLSVLSLGFAAYEIITMPDAPGHIAIRANAEGAMWTWVW